MPFLRLTCLATGLVTAFTFSITTGRAQELIAPGQQESQRPNQIDAESVDDLSDVLPIPKQADDESDLLLPFDMNDLPDNPPDPNGGPLELDSLEAYRRRLESHNERTERAKMEARARFESRSRDLIPGLPAPQRTESTPTQPDDDDLLLSPRIQTNDRSVEATKEKSRELPPPLRSRRPQTPARPQRLGGATPPAANESLPRFRPVPPANRFEEDEAVESSSDLNFNPPTAIQPVEKATPNKDVPKPETNSRVEPLDDRNPASVLDPNPQPQPARSSAAASNHWPKMMQHELDRWPLPATFASYGGNRLSGHPGSVTCRSCGGCVDRSGVGIKDKLHTKLGIGTRAKPACQCWRCPQNFPFNLYGPGNYVGPARSAPLPEYRVRAGDQVQLTFLIKTVRSVGSYRLVVGDELLVESEADEKLTRGTLERGLEIQPDGTITLRFIGQVHAAGQTIDQLRELLNERYTRYYPDPSIDVTPVLTGNVARQIREAISGSEGFNPQQTVQTVTPEGTIRLPRLGAVPTQGLTLGELKREINLRYDSMSAGLDVEVVLEQQAPHYIYVLGEVGTPGRFEIDAPTTVLGGVSLAGGYVPGANLRQIVIFRRGPNWEMLSTILDLRGALLGRESNPPDEIWLQDGDVVVIPPSPIRLFDRFVSQVFTEGIYGVVPFSGFGFAFGDQN